LLIVQCEMCEEVQVIPGRPDEDGVARARWVCRRCGTSQVAVMAVSSDGRSDLRKIVRGLCFACEVVSEE